METDDRGRAPRRRLGTRRDDHSGRRQREHVSTLQGERSVRAATGDTTVRTSVIANADIGPPHNQRSDEQPGESAERRDVYHIRCWRDRRPRAVSVQVVSPQRHDLDGRPQLEFLEHIHMESDARKGGRLPRRRIWARDATTTADVGTVNTSECRVQEQR